MSMGNYLREEDVSSDVMAARTQPVGIAHLTVVPSNFEPETDASHEGEENSCE